MCKLEETSTIYYLLLVGLLLQVTIHFENDENPCLLLTRRTNVPCLTTGVFVIFSMDDVSKGGLGISLSILSYLRRTVHKPTPGREKGIDMNE